MISTNLLIGSSPILFNTSLSIFTICVCLNVSYGGACDNFPFNAGAWCELYRLVPNILVWVAPNPPVLIFLLNCNISSDNALSFSLSSSEYLTILSTTNVNNYLIDGLYFSYCVKHNFTKLRNSSEYCSGSSVVNYLFEITLANSKGLLPENAGFKHKSSCKIHPKLHISAFSL